MSPNPSTPVDKGYLRPSDPGYDPSVVLDRLQAELFEREGIPANAKVTVFDVSADCSKCGGTVCDSIRFRKVLKEAIDQARSMDHLNQSKKRAYCYQQSGPDWSRPVDLWATPWSA